jgi:phosphoribosylanthranilate isomerase
MQVKVCGMTDTANMIEVASLKPDYVGFIFYASSPRDITNRIRRLQLGKVPKGVGKVAVLVNEDLGRARELVLEYGFEAVQLHGDESPAYCERIGDLCKVIKSIPVGHSLPDHVLTYEGSIDLLLFDTASQKRGGSGVPFNHELLLGYKGNTPFFLGGGISPGDVDRLNILAGELDMFAGVDLNSRFETNDGIKDVQLIKTFMKELKV